jgi:uncharacterized damage-inducible protein DinB
MAQRIQWFERTFDFNFPVGMFPFILERLRGTPVRVEELVRFYPARIYTLRRNNGWSIQEHVGHLFDLDALHEGRIDDYIASKPILRAADLENKKTHKANHNASSIDTILRNFRSARQRFVYRLENLDEQIIGHVAQHPRLKQPMRLVDMMLFVAEHDDHHLARITQLAKELLNG